MPPRRRAWLALLLAVLLAIPWASAHAEDAPHPRGGLPTGQHSAAEEAELDAELHRAIEFVYRSRLADATRISDTLLQRFPHDPRVHLLEARVLRETFPDQSTDKTIQDNLATPIHATLERGIEDCDALIRVDPMNAGAWGYRGWARLFKAQIYSLCDQYWSAGREAKRGKNDLDRALELDPENTDAKGILGTYLYFADVLPRVVKLAGAIIRVPGGDRARGLLLLGESAAGGGYNRIDARALLGAIEFAFEGDYDAGIARFEGLLRDFPDSPRMMEPIAALDLVRPRGTSDTERVGRVARMYATHPADWYRQLSHRLSFYQALAEIVQGHVDEARARLEEVRQARPTTPNWFPGDVALCLAEAHLLVGDGGAARALAGDPLGGKKVVERLRFGTAPGAAASSDEASTFRAVQEAARVLYAGDLETARRSLSALAPADDPGVQFYRGELARISGQGTEAATHFESLTRREIPERWRLYKILAFSRLAELHGKAGNARLAAETLQEAVEFDDDRDLLRHLIRARRRYFELLSEGRALPAVVVPGWAGSSSESR